MIKLFFWREEFALHHFPKWATFIVLSFLLIFTVFSNSLQSYRHNDITKYMEEAAQLVVNQSIDKSSRVSEEQVIISETIFETAFQESFSTLSGSFSVSAFNFEYLVDESGHYKAVRIQIVDENNTPYQITYVTDA